jgi:hypothetical protein
MKLSEIFEVHLQEEDLVAKYLSNAVANPSPLKKSKKQTFYNMVKESSKKRKRKWVQLEDLSKDSGIALSKLNRLAQDYQKHNWKFRRLSFEGINGKMNVSILR